MLFASASLPAGRSPGGKSFVKSVLFFITPPVVLAGVRTIEGVKSRCPTW
jgi:hypothetical protein